MAIHSGFFPYSFGHVHILVFLSFSMLHVFTALEEMDNMRSFVLNIFLVSSPKTSLSLFLFFSLNFLLVDRKARLAPFFVPLCSS